MAPGSRTPPFPTPGSGHAAAVRPGPNGLTGSPRAVPRASGVCGTIGGAGGRGAGAGKGPAGRAAPRGGGTLWPPSSPPPTACKFRSPGRRVSLTSFSCVQREREWAGPRQTSFSETTAWMPQELCWVQPLGGWARGRDLESLEICAPLQSFAG